MEYSIPILYLNFYNVWCTYSAYTVIQFVYRNTIWTSIKILITTFDNEKYMSNIGTSTMHK